MRVIIFQDRFAELVRTGQKMQTIRKKARCKPGDELSLRKWTGKPYRSKQETLLTTKCKEISPFRIEDGSVPAGVLAIVEEWAKADGFSSFAEMQDWFKKTHGLPFEGERIVWV